jgi:hypothetical protein
MYAVDARDFVFGDKEAGAWSWALTKNIVSWGWPIRPKYAVINSVTYSEFAWLIIRGSGFDDWVCHFFTITINYDNSQSMTAHDSLHSLLGHEHLLFHCDEWRKTNHCSHTELPCESRRVESYVTTDGKSACLSCNKSPIWGLQPDFYYCQLRVCWRGALSLTGGRVCRLQ